MSQVFKGLKVCFTYLDDILIYNTLWKKYLKDLETVFSLLQAVNLKIKISKCQFFKQHLHYIGHLISEQGIQPLLDMILTVTNLAVPKH